MDPVEMPAETITAEIMRKCTTPLSDDHDDKFGVPSLEELGEWGYCGRKQKRHDDTFSKLKFKIRSWINMFSNVISAGFDTEGLSSAVWPGGETEALTRLERHLERKVSQIRLKIL